MRYLSALSVIVFGFALASCGGSEISKEDMGKAWAATSSTLSGGQTRAAAGGLSAADANMTFDYSCPTAGTASFSGNYDVSGTTGSYNGSFDFTVGYAACEASGITIDGDLTYAAEYNSSTSASGTTLDYTFTYQGTLTFAGDVSGECEIDMVGTMSMSAGSTGLGGYDMSYSGTICGYDASSDLSASYGG